jgi:hypothetical protein
MIVHRSRASAQRVFPPLGLPSRLVCLTAVETFGRILILDCYYSEV